MTIWYTILSNIQRFRGRFIMNSKPCKERRRCFFSGHGKKVKKEGPFSRSPRRGEMILIAQMPAYHRICTSADPTSFRANKRPRSDGPGELRR